MVYIISIWLMWISLQDLISTGKAGRLASLVRNEKKISSFESTDKTTIVRSIPRLICLASIINRRERRGQRTRQRAPASVGQKDYFAVSRSERGLLRFRAHARKSFTLINTDGIWPARSREDLSRRRAVL